MQWSFGDLQLDLHRLGQYAVESLELMWERIRNFQSRTDSSKYFNISYGQFVKNPSTCC